MSRNVLIALLAAPLLVITLGIVRAERHFDHAQRWSFDVTGYDPRDMLRGHYLQYRLDLHEQAAREACEGDYGDRCCLCLTATSSGVPPQVQRATCETARASCNGALQTRYLSTLTRYYIPEASAQKLTQRFQAAAAKHDARLVVAVDENGKPQIEALLVDGSRL